MGFFWYNAHRRTEEEAAKQRAPGAADRRELSEKETQAHRGRSCKAQKNVSK